MYVSLSPLSCWVHFCPTPGLFLEIFLGVKTNKIVHYTAYMIHVDIFVLFDFSQILLILLASSFFQHPYLKVIFWRLL